MTAGPASARDPRAELPILFFRPSRKGRVHRGQVAYHQSVARIRLVRGGNRSGKTEILAEEGVETATNLEAAWFMKHAPRGTIRTGPQSVWLAGETFETARVLAKKARRLIPPSLVAHWPEKEPITVRLTNGSEIAFKSYSQGRSAFETFDVDQILLDEKPPEDIFTECLARIIDRRGTISIAQTPTDGLSWVYRRIFKPWMNRDREPIKGHSIECFAFATEDNPFVPKDEIDLFAASLDEDERLVRLFGEFMPIEGRAIFRRARLSEIAVSLPPPIWRGEVEVVDGRAKLHGDEHGRLSIWKYPAKGRAYANGWDVALGVKGGDYTAGSSIDRLDDHQAYEWHGHIKPGDGARVGMALARLYNEGYLGWEVENHGHVWSEVVGDHYPKILYRDDPDAVKGSNWSKMGWSTNSKTKPLLIKLLDERLKMADPGFRSFGLVQEMMTFIHKPDSGKDEAANGAFDDRVMAHGIALRVDRMCPKEGPAEERDPIALQLRLLDPRSRQIVEGEMEERRRSRDDVLRSPEHEDGFGTDW